MSLDVYDRPPGGDLPAIHGRSLVCNPEKDLLASLLPPHGLFLEIGTWAGASIAYILDKAPTAVAFCLDTYEGGHGNAVPMPDDLWAFVANSRLRPGRMFLFVGDVRQLKCFVVGQLFDVAFVDGDHSLKGCYDDLCAAETLVKPGGAIALHDIILPQDATTVYGSQPHEAMMLFLNTHRWEIVQRNNVTVVLRRKES